MGLDPNYAGGVYRGQRTRERDDGAAYGSYRAAHAHDLETAGGWSGRNTGAGQIRRASYGPPSGPVDGPRGIGRGLRDIPGGRERGPRSAGPVRGSIPPYARGFVESRGPAAGPGERRFADRGGRGRDYGGDFENGRGRSLPLRYDAGFNRYGDYGSGGFTG
jgi:hypothetical protein